jgi:F-type H+-transporting ATPase subunit b
MLYLLAAEEGGAGGGHGINPLDASDPANMMAGFWALGIFLVLVFVLKKFAWGHIVAGLDAREARINASLEKAAEIEAATAKLAETNRQLLDEAQREAQGIIADSRDAAKVSADEILAKAQAEIDGQRDRVKRELALEFEKAKADLRAGAVELTLMAAGKLIGKTLTAEDQRRLAEEALADAETVARN